MVLLLSANEGAETRERKRRREYILTGTGEGRHWSNVGLVSFSKRLTMSILM